MITRALSRAKTLQVLYANINCGNTSITKMEHDLTDSLDKTYELYHYLLLFPVEFTGYLARRLEEARTMKLAPTAEDLNPNLRFVQNRLASLLADNTQLLDFVDAHGLTWHEAPELFAKVYRQLTEQPFFQNYMTAEETTFAADVDVWRKIFKHVLQPNELFRETAEELSAYLCDDLDVVISFVDRTLRSFKASDTAERPLLPLFTDDDDKIFPHKLLQLTVMQYEASCNELNGYIENWDVNRLAFMDTLIIAMAMAELSDFPSIPVNVTLNEYIELAKSYSTNKSGNFVNGVLDKIVTNRRNSGLLVKVAERPANPFKKA
ncbi:MAG: transcription antitermination protein NusB [Bacteroidales bacterium]|nr:transcription antitermination protein NusB [Bacteroidales bacterium]